MSRGTARTSGRAARAAAAVAVLAAAAPFARAQQHARAVEHLGDPALGEAAEIELVALGTKAVPVLEPLLAEWNASTERDRARLLGALRVVDLLGPAAAELVAVLTVDPQRSREELRLPWLAALGSCLPHATSPTAEVCMHQALRADDAAALASFLRLTFRNRMRRADDVDGWLAVLAKDRIFEREAAAEALGARGDARAVDALHRRLVDRARPPLAHDALRHNGFPVPVVDTFVLRASEALIALAPDDPRCAVAFGCRAALHPHRAVRLAALRTLGGFGTSVGAAATELASIAAGEDTELAIEALKLLGMAGQDAAHHVPSIEPLAAREGTVGRLAEALVARLRAGGKAPAVALAAAAVSPAIRPEVAAATDAVAAGTAGPGSAAWLLLHEHADAAWPPLLDRLRRDHSATPMPVLRALVSLAATRSSAERDVLRYAIGSFGGDVWYGPMFSTSSHARQLRAAEIVLLSDLSPPADDTDGGLVAALADAENASLRLAAARRLARRPEAVAALVRTDRGALDALLAAASTAAPKQVRFQTAPNTRSGADIDITAPLHGAVAVALAECPLDGARCAQLLPKVLAHDDEAAVARAVTAWGAHGSLADVERAAADPRPTVAAAAKAVLAARGK